MKLGNGVRRRKNFISTFFWSIKRTFKLREFEDRREPSLKCTK